MKRISTDVEYLDDGKLVIDADGIPFEPASKDDVGVAGQALGQRIDNEKWRRGRLNPAFLASLDDAPEGYGYVATAANATAYGLPEDMRGAVTIETYKLDGWNMAFQKATTYVQYQARIAIRIFSGGRWFDWKRVDANSLRAELDKKADSGHTHPELEQLIAGGTAGGAGTKIVPLALTAPGGSNSVLTQDSGAVRIIRSWAHNPYRVRVHISNKNPANRTFRDNIGASLQLISAQADGTIEGTTSLGYITIPGEGEWVSGWVDVPNPESDWLGINAAWSGQTGKTQQLLQGGGWVKTTNAGWTDTQTTGWEWVTQSPFYIWFEAEAPANAPVIMVNGDSISIGTATSNPVQDSWVAIHARERGALPILMSQHGSGMSWWGTNSTRWDDMYPGVDVKPDAIISALGQNDLTANTLEWQKTRYAELNGVYSTRWPNIPVYAASITPSNKAPDLEVQRRDFNAWAKSAPHGERGYLDVAAPIATADDEDIKPEYAADHVHPNTAGMRAMATVLNAYPVTSKAVSDEALEKAVSAADRMLYGQGSPEGKIAAPVGSMYIDSVATAGAVRWVKTSGTGSTGWRVEYGDTGGRRIFSQFSHLTTSTSSNLSIQRLGDSVEMVVHTIAFDVDGVAAWSKIADLPAGFAPRTVFRQPLTLPSAMLEFRPNGEIRTTGTAIEKDAVVSFRVQWITPEPWPTTLPGLPV